MEMERQEFQPTSYSFTSMTNAMQKNLLNDLFITPQIVYTL